MISLKESFRLMNYIDNVISQFSYYIKNTDNAIKITEEHYKNIANYEAFDEKKDVTAERLYPDATIVDIMYLINMLVNEKAKLTLSIEDAKRNLKLNYKDNGKNIYLDSAIEIAKRSRDFANTLKTLIDLKATKVRKLGTGYKFNAEGNETTYRYDIDVIRTIDFDRNIVNDNYKRLLDKADKLSIMIEDAMLKEIVDYDFPYSIYDSYSDIVDKYMASK